MLQIQHVKIFPETVAVKVLVGIIEENRLAVFLGHRIVARRRHSLPERCAVFEREARLGQFVAVADPFARFAACALVSFVHEDEVVSLERLDRDAHARSFFLFHQLCDFYNPHRVLLERLEAAVLQRKACTLNARLLHIFQMLLRKPLVRRHKQNVVERFLAVMEKLPIMEMHQDRFAAARCHPECQLGQVVVRKCGVLYVHRTALAVPLVHESIQLLLKNLFVVEPSVKEQFRNEKRKMLKITQCKRLVAMFVEIVQVAADVRVVTLKVLLGDKTFRTARENCLDQVGAPAASEAFFYVAQILQHRLI